MLRNGLILNQLFFELSLWKQCIVAAIIGFLQFTSCCPEVVSTVTCGTVTKLSSEDVGPAVVANTEPVERAQVLAIRVHHFCIDSRFLC